jgi:hypothetical protein
VVAGNTVIGVAMNDPQFFTFGRFIAVFVYHFDIAHLEIVFSNVFTQEFIVIANDVIHTGIFFFGFSQYLPDNTIVFHGPVPLVGGYAPTVDDVAHQEEVVTTVGLEKLIEKVGLASPGAQVNVGNPDCATLPLFHELFHDSDTRRF